MVIKDGINRDANNRSGMLWEIERILKERKDINMEMPKFLLMENVGNILSALHIENFKEWINYLEEIGYTNHIYQLNSNNFGIPQKRVRAYMLSIFTNKDELIGNKIESFFEKNNLQKKNNIKIQKNKTLKNILRTNYKIEKYKIEADACQPNDTDSRKEIFNTSDMLYDGKKVLKDIVATVTTRQDRSPNSGIILYESNIEGKSKYRYLTPRECFMLMGFEEKDYQIIIDNNFVCKKDKCFFTRDKLYKMAGNSIVVNVLEEIFRQMLDINNNILNDKIKIKEKHNKQQILVNNNIYLQISTDFAD